MHFSHLCGLCISRHSIDEKTHNWKYHVTSMIAASLQLPSDVTAQDSPFICSDGFLCKSCIQSPGDAQSRLNATRLELTAHRIKFLILLSGFLSWIAFYAWLFIPSKPRYAKVHSFRTSDSPKWKFWSCSIPNILYKIVNASFATSCRHWKRKAFFDNDVSKRAYVAILFGSHWFSIVYLRRGEAKFLVGLSLYALRWEAYFLLHSPIPNCCCISSIVLRLSTHAILKDRRCLITALSVSLGIAQKQDAILGKSLVLRCSSFYIQSRVKARVQVIQDYGLRSVQNTHLHSPPTIPWCHLYWVFSSFYLNMRDECIDRLGYLICESVICSLISLSIKRKNTKRYLFWIGVVL